MALLVGIAATSVAAPITYTDVQDAGELDAGGFSPVPLVSEMSIGSGRVYTNIFGPPANGQQVNSVGIAMLTSATTVGFANGVTGIDGAADNIFGIFTLQGNLQGVSGLNPTGETLFTSGQLKIVKAPDNTIAVANPTTWTSGNLTTIATYTLTAPTELRSGTLLDPDGAYGDVNGPPLPDGTGSPLDIAFPIAITPADDVNISGGNIAIGSQLSTLLLLQEGNDDVDGNLLNFLDSSSGIGALLPISSEGLIVDTTTVISNLDNTAVDAADLAELNALFGEFFAGEDFADGLGAGPGSFFNLDFAGGSLDLIGSVNGPVIPAAIAAVPEPNSVVIWSLLGLLTGSIIVARSRYRRLPRVE